MKAPMVSKTKPIDSHPTWKVYLESFLVGFLFACLSWFGETWVHVYFFGHGPFRSEIIPDDPNEFWMRVAIAVLFMLMAWIFAYLTTQKMVYKRRMGLAYKALAVMREGCLITDSENKILYVNKRYEEISEYSLKEVIGKNPNVLSSGRQDKAFYQALWEALHTKGYWEGEVWNRKQSGELYPQWTNISVVKDRRGKIRYHVGVFSDITSKKAAEEKIKRYAYYDPLTDLPNRRFFIERLKQAIKMAKRDHQQLAVLFLDLDHFKPINDQHGHLVGDLFLQVFARLIQESVREVDTVSRFGGDEFVVLLPNVTSKANAMDVARKLLAVFHANPIDVKGHTFPISVCIGGAIYPESAAESEALITAADHRMYDVKESGRNGIAFDGDA